LSEDRFAEAEQAMRNLLVLARRLTFLSNDDITALPEQLRKRGLCLDLCDEFGNLVKKYDWRPVASSQD
jgi:hypothetical protein